MPTKAELVEQLRTELKDAKAIAAKAEAENRPYSADERAALEQRMAAAKSLKGRIDDAGVMDAMNDLGTQLATGGAGVTGSKALPAWALKGRTQSTWAKSTREIVEKQQNAGGAKALVSGSIDVPAPIAAEIVTMPEFPLTVLDLLVDRIRIGGNEFSFVRQSTRTDNARPVADGTEKPTSIYTVAEVSDHVTVVAHLSEQVPERLFQDHADLESFLADEMERGLRLAVEEQLLSGDGEDIEDGATPANVLGTNLVGLLNTSGIRTQAWNTDLLTTSRKAATALQVAGEVPNAWALNPLDVEALDLLQDNEARMYYAGPQQQIVQSNPLWSLPIVPSLAVPQGTGVLGDWTKLRLVTRDDARLDVDRSGELFRKNLVQLRVEQRVGVAVLRPGAFISVDLAA